MKKLEITNEVHVKANENDKVLFEGDLTQLTKRELKSYIMLLGHLHIIAHEELRGRYK